MKKIYTLLLVVVMSVSAMAQQEIGVVVGGMNGLSYKYWFSNNFALQTDLAVGLTVAPTGIYYQGTQVIGNATSKQYDFTINPNALYHWGVGSNFKIYAGGGLNFGLVSDIGDTDPNDILGKFGLNADLGCSYRFSEAPLTLSFDFRPGYGLAFRDAKTPHASFFDWKLAAAVRYCF